VIKAMLLSIDVPLEKLKFVRGTDYQLSKVRRFGEVRIRILLSSTKSSKKNLDSFCFVTSL
jgi:tyrosyl-tRNA synthetase